MTEFSRQMSCLLGCHLRRGPGGRRGRRRHAPGADPGYEDQPAEPLRRLRERGRAVPQGPRRYQTGPQGFLAAVLAKPGARAVVEAIFSGFIRMRGARVRRGGGAGAPGAGPIAAGGCDGVTGTIRARSPRRRPASPRRNCDACHEAEGLSARAVREYPAPHRSCGRQISPPSDPRGLVPAPRTADHPLLRRMAIDKGSEPQFRLSTRSPSYPRPTRQLGITRWQRARQDSS
jgi:hypothetical protein